MKTNAVLRKALHDSRRTLLWLVIGWGLYVLFVIAFYPTIYDQADEFNEMISSYPKELMGMFLGDATGTINIAAPGTFIHIYFASYGILLMGAMAIAQAFNAITNAERDGTLDVMLSLPVSRRSYLVGRFTNTLIMLVTVLGASFLIFLGASLMMPEFDITPLDLFLAIFGALFPLVVVATFAYMLAALVPSSKHFAGAVAYLVLVGSYLVHGFATSVEQLDPIRPLLLFHYYNAGTIVSEGVNWGHWALLSAVALVYAAIAWWWFDRKELGV